MTEYPASNASQSRAWPWLLAMVIGMIAFQFFTRQAGNRPAPGPARGDITLSEDVLPELIDEWHCVSFQPAISPEQLPEGQFWWTHLWHYQCGSMTAIVAFDQADWKSWHELTICYQGIDWTLSAREIVDAPFAETGSDLSGHAPHVIASLEKPSLSNATLVFSLFDQTGDYLSPPIFRIPSSDREGPGTAQKLKSVPQTLIDRITYELPAGASLSSDVKTYDRILQSQVFAQHADPLSVDQMQSLNRLHCKTRALFRRAWLQFDSSP